MAATASQSTFGMPSLSLNGPSKLSNGVSGSVADPAAKTAALLREWRAMTPQMWDAPSPRQPEYNLSAPPVASSAPKSTSGGGPVDVHQAAERTDALLQEWKNVCKHQQDRSSSLSWDEQLQHQISQQQSEALLAKVTSLEYGR